MRYRTLNCMECGRPFLERNKDSVYRVGARDMPGVAHAGADGLIHAVCSRCQQKYTVTLSMTIEHDRAGLPLHLQPQTLFIVTEPIKRLRDLFCLECGKAYFSVSDRIGQMIDNVTPVELLDPDRLGPMEARCKFQHCKQRWYVRI
jgi:hypothetical protein